MKPTTDETYAKAILLRNCGAVKRYHTVRTLRTQDLAAHSWGVAALVLCIWPNPSAALLQAALMHDCPELRTGDVPATAKWSSAELSNALDVLEDEFYNEFKLPSSYGISEPETKVLKWCDGAELVFWCLEEYAMGDNFAITLVKRVLPRLQQLGHPTAEAQNIFDYLMYATSGDFEDMVENDGH